MAHDSNNRYQCQMSTKIDLSASMHYHCVSQVCITVIQMPDKNNLEDGKFILAHSFEI